MSNCIANKSLRNGSFSNLLKFICVSMIYSAYLIKLVKLLLIQA